MRLLAFFLFLSLTFAQSTEVPKKARLEGSVVSITGEPVARAQVRLLGPPAIGNGQISQAATFNATSGADGKWIMENVDPGNNYRLTAQRQGFVNASYGARSANSPAAPIVLSAGHVLTGLTIVMTPQAVISGRVTDQTGDPVQNISVQVLRRAYTAAGRQLLPSGVAQTNDLGEYRIANLTPGRYYLSATDRLTSISNFSAPSAEANLPTYYPNAPDAQSAAALEVAAGADLRGMDLRMRKGKVFQVRGKVTGQDGKPTTGVLLMVNPKENLNLLIAGARMTAQVRPDGTFEVRNVAPGTYTIQSAMNAVINGVPAPKLAGRLDFTVSDADLTDLTLALSSGTAITGRLRLEGGDLAALAAPAANRQPVVAGAGAIVVIGGGPSGISVALTELGPTGIGGTTGPVAADGSFKLEGLSPAKYRLNVGGIPMVGFIKSATLNGADVLKNGIDLTSGGGGTLDIVVSKKPAEVSGTVQVEQNQSAAGLVVSLWSADAPIFPDSLRTVNTSQAGTFSFPGLRPGTYYVAAWQEIEPGLTLIPEFFSQFTADAQKLTVTEGSTAGAQLKPIPAARIQAAEAKLP